MAITVKMTGTGKLACFEGKTKMNALREEVIIPAGPTRAAILKMLDPVLRKATRIVFGTGFKPADYNELHNNQKFVRQVMADSPRALIPIFCFVVKGTLKASPELSVVSRFKKILMRESAQDFKLGPNGGCYYKLDSKGKNRKETDANKFWSSYRDFEKGPLTEAGWRYLQRLSKPAQRALVERHWEWSSKYVNLLSVLGQLNLPEVPMQAFRVLEFGLAKCADDISQQAYVRLVATRFSKPDDVVTNVEIDMVRDWFYEEKRVIQPGTRWETLVERAFTLAGAKMDLQKEKLVKFQWTPPIAPFVADEGIAVIPLASGPELLAEGLEMDNCLRHSDSYARRAVEGISQVFSVRGTPGRASVEFARQDKGATWSLAQVEGPGAKEITHPAMLRVVEKIVQSMRGAQ